MMLGDAIGGMILFLAAGLEAKGANNRTSAFIMTFRAAKTNKFNVFNGLTHIWTTMLQRTGHLRCLQDI
jgi:hypothetical protein